MRSMTLYCPTCLSEYQDSIDQCPDDGTTLTKVEPKADTQRPVDDFYAASSQVEASRIEALLKNRGIACTVSRSQMAQLPMVNDPILISVNNEDCEKAKEAIEMAISDGILSGSGMFL